MRFVHLPKLLTSFSKVFFSSSFLIAGYMLSIHQAAAQLLKPVEGRDFDLQSKFNPEFIRSNRIAEITCLIEQKKDGDRIRSTYEKVVYQFYDDGQTRMISRINYKWGDTAVTYYEYVGNRLDCEVRNDAAGMFSYCYTYDDEGRPLERRYGRSKRFESLTASINPGTTFDITTEKYVYQKLDNQLHSTLYNAAGRPFQKEIRYYDEHNYLVQYLKDYVISSSQLLETYTYDQHGWLAEKQVSQNAKNERFTYSYDEVGNLLEERLYQGDSLRYRKEIVYMGDSMLINAELKRDEVEKYILITTYSYVFRP